MFWKQTSKSALLFDYLEARHSWKCPRFNLRQTYILPRILLVSTGLFNCRASTDRQRDTNTHTHTRRDWLMRRATCCCCLLLYAWIFSGIAYRACHLSSTFFSCDAHRDKLTRPNTQRSANSLKHKHTFCCFMSLWQLFLMVDHLEIETDYACQTAALSRLLRCCS